MSNAASPAMPQTEYQHNDAGEYIAETRGGLTKREHFAAMALQGILTQHPPYDVIHEEMDSFMRAVSEYAVMAADALLEELDKYYD